MYVCIPRGVYCYLAYNTYIGVNGWSVWIMRSFVIELMLQEFVISVNLLARLGDD